MQSIKIEIKNGLREITAKEIFLPDDFITGHVKIIDYDNPDFSTTIENHYFNSNGNEIDIFNHTDTFYHCTYCGTSSNEPEVLSECCPNAKAKNHVHEQDEYICAFCFSEDLESFSEKKDLVKHIFDKHQDIL